MSGSEPLRLHVDPAAKPTAIRAPSQVPLAWHTSVREGLERDVRLGVLERVPLNTPDTWCSRMHITPKADGSPRRVVDYGPLNKHAPRQIHHTQPPWSIAASIPSNTVKSVLDAWHGYHSVPIAPEDRHLTTFLTPWGKFRYLTTPQGFISAGDGYTDRTDRIIADFPNVKKCVDDSILWDEDIETNFYQICSYLDQCSSQGIIFNPKKFQFAQSSVKYLGFQITDTGIKPTEEFISNILDFLFTTYDLKMHSLVHIEPNPLGKTRNNSSLELFTCNSCDYTSGKESLLKAHNSEYHMQCIECGDTVGNNRSYIDHMKKKHSDDLNTIINLATVTLAKMYVDIIENEVGSCPVDDCSIHQCDFCNYGATSSSILEVHIMGDHADNLVEQIVNFDEYQFNCKSCIFGSNNETEITEHTRKKHERQEMFPCNVCGVMFGFEVALDDHVRRNHMTEPITDAYDVAADKASTEVSESPIGNDAPKESLSNHYLAAILEQNIELFDKIACLTNVINKLDTNQCDLWDEVNKINKTNDDILNNQKYIQNDVSILATSAKNLHDDVSRVSASINGLHDQNHTSMNQNKATLSLMKEIIDNKPASGATVPHSMGHKNSSPVFPDTTFKCHICGKLFESTTCLKNHIETMHPRKPESDIQVIPIPCSKCDFKAHTGVQMKKHMQVRHFSDRKLLYVGDSVTMNVNFGLLERETQTAIRAAEASGTDADSTGNNAALIDVLDLELEREKFNFLVIAAGPTEISKLQVNQPSDAKLLREETVDIAKKVISIAEAALEKFPHLEKVILVRTTPRFDPLPIDPAQLKPQLALLADSVLFGLWFKSMYKEKIVLGNHDLSE